MKQVVCALIVNDGKLLIVQHGPHTGHPHKWEFPGGKIQPGELQADALKREVFEELNIFITVDEPLDPVIFRYPGKEIHLFPFLCRWIKGTFILREHVDYQWINPVEIHQFDMLGADFQMLEEGRNFEKLLIYQERNREDRMELDPDVKPSEGFHRISR